MDRPKFDLGPRITATPGSLALMGSLEVSPRDLLSRHAGGDWGDLDDEDKQANDHALKDGSRILSAYNLGDPEDRSERVWIITEAELEPGGRRYGTTILLPSDY